MYDDKRMIRNHITESVFEKENLNSENQKVTKKL